MFVLLPVHVRAAVHDRTLSNEIYLYLFFGIVDCGGRRKVETAGGKKL